MAFVDLWLYTILCMLNRFLQVGVFDVVGVFNVVGIFDVVGVFDVVAHLGFADPRRVDFPLGGG